MQTSSPQKQTDRTTGKSNTDESNSTSTTESDTKLQSRHDPIETRATDNRTRDQYYNPDPLARLIGKSNKSTIIIHGKQCTALIDSGAQVTTITVDLINKLKLPIYELKNITKLQRYRGGNILYHGYTGVTMEIPEIKGFKEEVLMMVIDDDDYGEKSTYSVGYLTHGSNDYTSDS